MLRIALIDLYNGEANRGIPMLKSIVARYAGILDLSHFDVRVKCEIPDLSHDIYIFSGGPGDPLEHGGVWQAPFYHLIESLWQHNRNSTASKKYVFFICHSFQMACHHFGLGEVSQRYKMSFGTYPVHKTHSGKEEPFFKELPDPFYIADFRRFQVTKPNHARFKKMGANILCLEKLRSNSHFERAIMSVRFSPEMMGTQFHPEADPDGLHQYFMEEDRRKSIEEEHGKARYERMMRDLKNPQKILRTFNTLIPAFLDNAIMLVGKALAIQNNGEA
jgi:GMP synthase-like glutamine amidotransferase